MKRSGLKRGKPLQRKARKVPKAFRHRRDPQYAAYVRLQQCILFQKWYLRGESPTMVQTVWHCCTSVPRACHVQSRGAGGDDRGNLYAGCDAAHDAQHLLVIRSFQARWGIDLKAEAERLYQQYVKEMT